MKKKKKAKAGRFPVGGLIVMLLLIGVILTAGYFGMRYSAQYDALQKNSEDRIAAAESALMLAEAQYAEADPESAAHVAERRQVTEEMIAQASAELDELLAESAETDAAISELEKRKAELESVEDFDYYISIYNEYTEGRDYVENLLSGD
ncbi:MAG: hypothetical protein IJP64_02855 [Oscillospiraceae bacterium]|nr:hypothetical protein [Oscillospiraceae bacterium]